MADEFILAGFFGFLLGLVVLYNFVTKLFVRETESPGIVCDESAGSSFQYELRGHADVIIVGAGVAGAALAYALAKNGRRVHVIERNLKEPDRIAGEFLHPGGYLKLVELGLQDCVSDIDAQRVNGYVLYKNGKSTVLSYSFKNYDSYLSGISFHNGRFVCKLREKAATLPNVRLEQGTVTSLIEEQGTIKGVHYMTRRRGQGIVSAYAPLTVVCDGGSSNLRRTLCTPTVDAPSCMVCLILENSRLPYPNYSHVIMGDPLPISFYPISSTEVRFMIDIPRQKVPSIANGEMADYLKTLVAPQIPSMLYHAFIAAVEKGNIRMSTNRSMPENSHQTAGAILLGDALNMRHPITGGGMTIALSDVVLLRDLLRHVTNLNDTYALCNHVESFYTIRKPLAFMINVFAGAIHKVISAPDDTGASADELKEVMRQACFSYLSLGGVFSTGPLAMASGISPYPMLLVLHLVFLAVCGALCILLPSPSPKRLWLAVRYLWGGTTVIFPIIVAEGIAQMFFPAILPAFVRALIKKFLRLLHKFINMSISKIIWVL